jgi:6-phosphogluconolactonase
LAVFLTALAGCGTENAKVSDLRAAPQSNDAPCAPPPTSPPTGNEFVYVANTDDASISAFKVDLSTGELTPVVGSPLRLATSKSSIAIHPTGRFAFVTNYPNVKTYAIDPDTGGLTLVAEAAAPSPESVSVDPSGRFVYVTNGTRSISAYTIAPTTGILTPLAGSPFAVAGIPLHITVDPTGRFVYTANGPSDNISAYTIDTTNGSLTPVAGSPFAAGDAPSFIAIDPTGKFAYVANYFSSDVWTYALDANTGAMRPAGVTLAFFWPLASAVGLNGRFVYVANTTGNLAAYTINPATGSLSVIPGSPFATGGFPDGIAIDATGQFVFVANAASDDVSAFRINPNSCVLTSVAGSPYAVERTPRSIVIARTQSQP